MPPVFLMPFGKFQGEPITRVPPGYLLWIINRGHWLTDKAKEELERRGTTFNFTVELSAHAVDRASQRLMHHWINTAKENEGLYTWLVRRAEEALKVYPSEDKTECKQIQHEGIVFTIEFSTLVPVVKTVWPPGTEDK